MRDVAIVGIGTTQFGRAQWSLLKMMCEASHEALTDAGIGDRKIDAVYVANMGAPRNNRMSGLSSALVDRMNLYPHTVAESPIGHRRWMIEYPLDKKFEVQHELGGAPAWVLTKETYYRAKARLVTGSRPVSAELLARSYPLRDPDLRAMLVQIEDTLEARI